MELRLHTKNIFQYMEHKIANYNYAQYALDMLCHAINQRNNIINTSNQKIDYNTYLQLRHLEFLFHRLMNANAYAEQLNEHIHNLMDFIESLHIQASEHTMCPCVLLSESCTLCQYCQEGTA